MVALQGKNILLTRTVAQNQQMIPLLQQYGANPVFFPCFYIKTLQPQVKAGLQNLALADKNSTDVIFSSRHGVQALLDGVDSLSQALHGFRIVVVGQKTASLLQAHGCQVDVIPQHASQQGLVARYATLTMPKQAFFFRAEQGSDALAAYFAQQHIPMQLVPSYRTLGVPQNPADVVAKLQAQEVDAVLLGSAKVAAFYAQKIKQLQLAASPVVVVMSAQVAAAADKVGLKVQLIAKQPSFAAMLDALSDYYSLT